MLSAFGRFHKKEMSSGKSFATLQAEIKENRKSLETWIIKGLDMLVSSRSQIVSDMIEKGFESLKTSVPLTD